MKLVSCVTSQGGICNGSGEFERRVGRERRTGWLVRGELRRRLSPNPLYDNASATPELQCASYTYIAPLLLFEPDGYFRARWAGGCVETALCSTRPVAFRCAIKVVRFCHVSSCGVISAWSTPGWDLVESGCSSRDS